MAAPANSEPRNYRLKLPVNIALTIFAVWFLAMGRYLVGGLLLAGSLAAIWMIQRGRNPWWMRSPLDRRTPPDSN
jgi:hypothetical protein